MKYLSLIISSLWVFGCTAHYQRIQGVIELSQGCAYGMSYAEITETGAKLRCTWAISDKKKEKEENQCK